jgi:predicted DNA-binding transcriptional regulator YafY
MKTLKQLERLRKAHKLIQQQHTGTPNEFADKLHISERELYRILEYLKELGAIISFQSSIFSYRYKENFDLLVNVSVQVIVNEELKTIYAGSTLLKENFENIALIDVTDGFWQ